MQDNTRGVTATLLRAAEIVSEAPGQVLVKLQDWGVTDKISTMAGTAQTIAGAVWTGTQNAVAPYVPAHNPGALQKAGKDWGTQVGALVGNGLGWAAEQLDSRCFKSRAARLAAHLNVANEQDFNDVQQAAVKEAAEAAEKPKAS